MRERRKTRLTREGWYYLFVTTFVLGGAVLRDVNLLVVLAGMMLGPVFYNWRLAKVTLRGISIRRNVPGQVMVDEQVTVEFVAGNRRLSLPATGTLVRDHVAPADGRSLAETRPLRDRVQAEVLIPHVDPEQHASASYRIALPRRGRFEFGPIHLSTAFPLGLVRTWRMIDLRKSVVALPKLGKLSREFQRVVHGQNVGSQVTQRRGMTEGDYYGLRDWRNGDSRRWIHWRTSAKRAALTVLQFEQPRNRDLVLLLDLYIPKSPSDRDFGMVELAVSFAATVVVDVCRRGGRLMFATSGLEERQWTSPASNRLMRDLLEYLAVVQPGSHNFVSPALKQLGGGFSEQRTIVISTRAQQAVALGERPDGVLWVDVSSEQNARYFEI